MVLFSLKMAAYKGTKSQSLRSKTSHIHMTDQAKDTTVQPKGHVTRGNFSFNLSRNDDDWKTLQVAEGVSHVRNISSQLAMPPAGNCLQLFLRQLENSCEQKTGFDCLIFTNCVAGCGGHVKRSNLSRNVAKCWGYFYFSCNSQRNILLPLQGVLQGKSFLQLVSQRLLRDKLQEKLPRVTWP